MFLLIEQYLRCEPTGEAYFATVDMRDPFGLRIGDASRGNITAANEKSPLVLTGRAVTKQLSIVGRFDNMNPVADFAYGNPKWSTANSDLKSPAFCEKPGEWS